ncbi:GRM5-like protein [Mya arenaria]|uniref:GRM5-like protein n=1 Tax=Mya arenaria TaxID=6604 RepID=A0ABY7G0C6_MYAAR|nr:GRM5-like protein [Mya arenaria]
MVLRNRSPLVPVQEVLRDIGVIRSSGLNLTLTPDVVISESRCGATCPACVETPEVSFAFIEGDTYLLGIISAHETEADFPFQCTQDLRSMDVLVVEAFLNTVNMSSNGAGLKLGALVLDDCYSSARMELILTKLMSGETLLTNPNNKEPLNIRDKVAAVVMTVSSTVTKVVATLMAEFGIPVISASASSPDLDDRVNFPYFLRKVVSDVEQARAMVKIVKRMGWQYVSMLYVTNNYGSKGKEAFVEEAAKNGICVADKVEGIPDVDVTDSSLLELYTRIQNHKTDVVVYFGTEARIKEFLELINTNLPFVFLASEDWGDNRHILDQGRNKSLGSLTMKNEVNDIIADEFKQYLTQLSPSTVNMSRNPWLAEYWEDGFQCDLDSSITNKYSEKCQNELRLSDTNISDAIIDQRILHTIDAIRAVFVGVLEAKNEFCSFENTFPCQLYDNERHVTKFVSFIRNARLLRNGQKTRVFNDDGNGNTGFDINNVQRDSNGLYYRNVCNVF